MFGSQMAGGLAPAVAVPMAVAVMGWYPLTDQAHAELITTIQGRPRVLTQPLLSGQAAATVNSFTHKPDSGDDHECER